MRPDHRRLRDFQCLVYGPFGAVSEIDQDAEPIALKNDPSSEISQAVVLGRFRLEVSDRVLGVMHQLNVPNAKFIGRLYARNIVLQERLPSVDKTICGTPASAAITSFPFSISLSLCSTICCLMRAKSRLNHPK